MACSSTSSSAFNFLSSFIPSKPPQPKNPPPNFIMPLNSSRTIRDGSVSACLSLANNNNNASSISSDEITAVVYPSVAYANTLYFRSAYNVQVIVDENEHEEKLINRFRREVMRAGVIQECRRRRYFENKQEKEKRKTREAAKRNRKRRPYRAPTQDKQEVSNKKEDDEEDNWELPAGSLPY